MLEKILVIGVIIYAIGCGGLDSKDESEKPQPSVTPSATPTEKNNPICNKDLTSFGKANNNLYKPIADGGGITYSGNPVFLLDERFVKEFDSCEIELKRGIGKLECVKADWNNYTCLGNGNRQQLRSKFKATQVKNNAKITCIETNQTCTFQLLGVGTGRYE